MNLPSSEDSSDSNECLITPGKLNLNSSFFQTSSKPSTSFRGENSNSTSADDSSDDFANNDEVDSTALLAEVMKNLENANKCYHIDKVDPSTSKSPLKLAGANSSVRNDEIASLLLQGETKLSTSDVDNESDVEIEDKKPSVVYSIPKEGVAITLPGMGMTMQTGIRRKKRDDDLHAMLRKKMNQTLRSNQVFIHKTGLLCWLAYGFHMNREINNCEILATSLSLVPAINYPKDLVDLDYLRKFTKWFKSQFKMEVKDISEGVKKETLLLRLREKKVYNHRELVLLFAATLRSIGLNCRLVLSLCPPPLKLSRDRLFQDSKGEMEAGKKNMNTVVKKEVKGYVKEKKKMEISVNKFVPENSSEMGTQAKLDAKKRAADILSKFANSPARKSIKMLEKSKIEETRSQEKSKIEISPKVRQLRSRVVTKDPQMSGATEKRGSSEEEKRKESAKLKRKRGDAVSNGKTTVSPKSAQVDSSSDEEYEHVSHAKKRKSVQQASKNSKTKMKKKVTLEETKEKVPIKNNADDFGDVQRMTASESDSDKEFQPKIIVRNEKIEVLKKKNEKKRQRSDSIDRRVLSSEDEHSEIVDVKGAQNIWVEVYVESEEGWISVNVPDDNIHCVSDIYKKAPKPVLYIIAWNSVGTVKDVTRRYCPHWLTVTRKQRIDENWWLDSLEPWKEKNTAICRAEDEMLLQRELEQPLPKTMGECKGHPLYALTRHLLKFEALFPPDAAPLGYLKTGDAIYSRYCVHTLCSRETWIKKARVVKPAQQPYKIVKAMPKYDKLSGTKMKDLPLELFGKWQTTQYVPPVAKNGIVPRNEYGNVDLFKECMLPIGTVHINLPALNRVARKLHIDCVPAIVGFNFGCRGAMPMTEGYVVCAEFEEVLREAWHTEQIDVEKRAREKRDKRIYGNWKKLIKGLFIRERLTARYDFNDNNDDDDDDENEDEKKPSTSAKSRSKSKPTDAQKANRRKRKKL